MCALHTVGRTSWVLAFSDAAAQGISTKTMKKVLLIFIFIYFVVFVLSASKRKMAVPHATSSRYFLWRHSQSCCFPEGFRIWARVAFWVIGLFRTSPVGTGDAAIFRNDLELRMFISWASWVITKGGGKGHRSPSLPCWFGLQILRASLANFNWKLLLVSIMKRLNFIFWDR